MSASTWLVSFVLVGTDFLQTKKVLATDAVNAAFELGRVFGCKGIHGAMLEVRSVELAGSSESVEDAAAHEDAAFAFGREDARRLEKGL